VVPMHRDYPAPAVRAGHTEPCPRHVRAVLDGRTVLDTDRAQYVWEIPFYPQYYVPLEDIAAELLNRPGSVRRYGSDARIANTARIEWHVVDAWYEEDEQVFVHPRNPYVRVDALRSRRTVRVEVDGVVLAESAAPVLVFETGLPTRYYFDRADLNWEHLVHTETQTACPYKGETSDYWSAVIGENVIEDLGWSYSFPTRQLLPIAGLVAFYNEHVDTYVDGELRPRPITHFTRH
jgi:uncharacterized protein (DUF427 family)